MELCTPLTDVNDLRLMIRSQYAVPKRYATRMDRTEICNAAKKCSGKNLPLPPLRYQKVNATTGVYYPRDTPLSGRDFYNLFSKPKLKELQRIAKKLGVFQKDATKSVLYTSIIEFLKSSGVPEPVQVRLYPNKSTKRPVLKPINNNNNFKPININNNNNNFKPFNNNNNNNNFEPPPRRVGGPIPGPRSNARAPPPPPRRIPPPPAAIPRPRSAPPLRRIPLPPAATLRLKDYEELMRKVRYGNESSLRYWAKSRGFDTNGYDSRSELFNALRREQREKLNVEDLRTLAKSLGMKNTSSYKTKNGLERAIYEFKKTSTSGPPARSLPPPPPAPPQIVKVTKAINNKNVSELRKLENSTNSNVSKTAKEARVAVENNNNSKLRRVAEEANKAALRNLRMYASRKGVKNASKYETIETLERAIKNVTSNGTGAENAKLAARLEQEKMKLAANLERKKAAENAKLAARLERESAELAARIERKKAENARRAAKIEQRKAAESAKLAANLERKRAEANAARAANNTKLAARLERESAELAARIERNKAENARRAARIEQNKAAENAKLAANLERKRADADAARAAESAKLAANLERKRAEANAARAANNTKLAARLERESAELAARLERNKAENARRAARIEQKKAAESAKLAARLEKEKAALNAARAAKNTRLEKEKMKLVANLERERADADAARAAKNTKLAANLERKRAEANAARASNNTKLAARLERESAELAARIERKKAENARRAAMIEQKKAAESAKLAARLEKEKAALDAARAAKNTRLEKEKMKLVANLERKSADADAARAAKNTRLAANIEKEKAARASKNIKLAANIEKEKAGRAARLEQETTKLAANLERKKAEANAARAANNTKLAARLERESAELAARLERKKAENARRAARIEQKKAANNTKLAARLERESAELAARLEKEKAALNAARAAKNTRLEKEKMKLVANLERKSADADAARAAKNTRLAANIEKEKAGLAARLERKRAEANAARAANNTKLAARLERESAELAARLERKSADADAARAAKNTRLAANIEKEKAARASKNTRLAANIEKEKAGRAARLEQETMKLTANLERKRAQVDAARASKNTKLAARLERESAELAARLERKSADADAARAAKNTRLAANIEKEKAGRAARLERESAELAARLERESAELAARLERKRAEANAARAAKNTKLAARLEQETAKLAANLERKSADADAARAAKNIKLAANIEKEKAGRAARLEQETTKLTANLERKRAEANAARAANNTKLAARLERESAELAARLERKKAENARRTTRLEQETAKLAANLERKRAEANAARASNNTKLAARLERESAELAARLERKKAENARRAARLEQETTKLAARLERESAELAARIERKKADANAARAAKNTKLAARLEQETAKLAANLERKRAEARPNIQGRMNKSSLIYRLFTSKVQRIFDEVYPGEAAGNKREAARFVAAIKKRGKNASSVDAIYNEIYGNEAQLRAEDRTNSEIAAIMAKRAEFKRKLLGAVASVAQDAGVSQVEVARVVSEQPKQNMRAVMVFNRIYPGEEAGNANLAKKFLNKFVETPPKNTKSIETFFTSVYGPRSDIGERLRKKRDEFARQYFAGSNSIRSGGPKNKGAGTSGKKKPIGNEAQLPTDVIISNAKAREIFDSLPTNDKKGKTLNSLGKQDFTKLLKKYHPNRRGNSTKFMNVMELKKYVEAKAAGVKDRNAPKSGPLLIGFGNRQQQGKNRTELYKKYKIAPTDNSLEKLRKLAKVNANMRNPAVIKNAAFRARVESKNKTFTEEINRLIKNQVDNRNVNVTQNAMAIHLYRMRQVDKNIKTLEDAFKKVSNPKIKELLDTYPNKTELKKVIDKDVKKMTGVSKPQDKIAKARERLSESIPNANKARLRYFLGMQGAGTNSKKNIYDELARLTGTKAKWYQLGKIYRRNNGTSLDPKNVLTIARAKVEKGEDEGGNIKKILNKLNQGTTDVSTRGVKGALKFAKKTKNASAVAELRKVLAKYVKAAIDGGTTKETLVKVIAPNVLRDPSLTPTDEKTILSLLNILVYPGKTRNSVREEVKGVTNVAKKAEEELNQARKVLRELGSITATTNAGILNQVYEKHIKPSGNAFKNLQKPPRWFASYEKLEEHIKRKGLAREKLRKATGSKKTPAAAIKRKGPAVSENKAAKKPTGTVVVKNPAPDNMAVGFSTNNTAEKEKKAATIIQAAFRGMRNRKRVAKMKDNPKNKKDITQATGSKKTPAAAIKREGLVNVFGPIKPAQLGGVSAFAATRNGILKEANKRRIGEAGTIAEAQGIYNNIIAKAKKPATSENEAATAIQAAFRGRRNRKRVAKMKDKLKNEQDNAEAAGARKKGDKTPPAAPKRGGNAVVVKNPAGKSANNRVAIRGKNDRDKIKERTKRLQEKFGKNLSLFPTNVTILSSQITSDNFDTKLKKARERRISVHSKLSGPKKSRVRLSQPSAFINDKSNLTRYKKNINKIYTTQPLKLEEGRDATPPKK
jgi:hypothetical protein